MFIVFEFCRKQDIAMLLELILKIIILTTKMEEIEEAKADTDASVLDEADKNIVGRDEDTAAAIIEATKTSHYTKNNLGLKLRYPQVLCILMALLSMNCVFHRRS